MAFVSDASPDQQNQNQPPGQTPAGQQAPITSAPNNSSAKGATGQPSNTGPSQPFTNLSSYLTANAPQIQAEGNQITGSLAGQYGQVTGAIDQAGTAFNDKVNAGYAPLNQGVIDSFNANPTAVANDPTQAAAFKGMYGDAYTGPANFESTPEYLGLSGQVQGAVSNAQNLQTPEGIQGYFSSGSPTYTKGMGTLDSSLIQGNPDVVSQIKTAAQPFANLPGYLTSAVTSGNAAAQAAAQQAQAAKAATTGAMGDKVTALNSGITTNLTAAQKAVQDYNTAQGKIVSQAQAPYVAAQNIPSASVPNFDLSGWAKDVGNPFKSFAELQPFTGVPSAASVATPGNYAELEALNALSGNSVVSPIDASTASLGGTFTAPGAAPTFDPSSVAGQWLQGTVGPAEKAALDALPFNNSNAARNQLTANYNDEIQAVQKAIPGFDYLSYLLAH